MNNKTLTILIPAFNESKRIVKTLDNIDAYISKTSSLYNSLPYKLNATVVSDGSTDNTDSTVNEWIQNKSKNKNSFTMISYKPNKGKGYAVREGILNIESDFILYTDADGASPIEELEKLISWIDKGFDIVIGSRIVKDNNSKVKMSFIRRFVGRVFHSLLKLCDLADVVDTQCGFKLFKTTVVKKIAINQKCFGFSFDIEYLYLARMFGYKIKEVSINWYHVEGSKVNLAKDSIKMFIEVLKIRFINKYN